MSETEIYDLTSEAFLRSMINIVESEENASRVRRHIKLFQIISGNQERVIKEKIALKFPESHDLITTINLKIAKKIINKLASVYSAGVVRKVKSKDSKDLDEQMTELLNAIYSDVDCQDRSFDQVMEKMNQYAVNHEYAEIFCHIDGENKIRFKPLPQQLFTALPNQTKTMSEVIIFKQDHTNMTEILRFIDWDNTTEEVRNSEITGLYTVWSKDFHFDFIRIAVREEGDNGESSVVFKEIVLPQKFKQGKHNPWKVYPFVQIKEDTEGVFYPYGSEVAEMGVEINVMLSDVVSIAEQQGFGQAVCYFEGDTPPQITKSGPTHVINIPNKLGNSKFDFANANPDLVGHLDIILAIIRLLLTTNDLTSDKVSGELNATNFASAIDRLIADAEWVGNVEDQRKKYINAEKNIFRIVIELLKYLMETDSWPEDYPKIEKSKLDYKLYELSLEFNNSKPLTTEKDKAASIDFLEEKGFIMPHEKHMRFTDGNMGEKEARKREDEIRAEKKKKAQEMLMEKVKELNDKLEEDREQDGDKDKPNQPEGLVKEGQEAD